MILRLRKRQLTTALINAAFTCNLPPCGPQNFEARVNPKGLCEKPLKYDGVKYFLGWIKNYSFHLGLVEGFSEENTYAADCRVG